MGKDKFRAGDSQHHIEPLALPMVFNESAVDNNTFLGVPPTHLQGSVILGTATAAGSACLPTFLMKFGKLPGNSWGSYGA